MEDLQKRIARNIAGIMAAKRPAVSIGALSVETEIDKSYLAKILRCERRMNVEQLQSIAKALKVDPATLLKS
jgi:hypothetical protein